VNVSEILIPVTEAILRLTQLCYCKGDILINKVEHSMNCHLLIRNGFIIDGTGKPGFYADIAVSDGKILTIAPKLDFNAERFIDASGLVVSPGFIDPHVHAELAVLSCGKFEDYLRQGVTTTVNGNCGHSITPYTSDNIFEYMSSCGIISIKEKERYSRADYHWDDFAGYIDTVKTKGTNLNMGFLLGHGALRWSVMRKSNPRIISASEEREIARLIEDGMEQGALGLSTGLAYNPSKYANTSELIKLSKIVHTHDGIYTTHLRTSIGIFEAVKEAIQIGEATGIRVQVSHLTPNCPEAFEEILSARSRGLEIALDTIPKSSGHFKRWDRFLQFILSSGQPLEQNSYSLQANLDLIRSSRKLLRKIRFKDRLIVFNSGDSSLNHRTLKDIADETQMSVDELFLQLLDKDPSKLTFCQGGLNRWDFPGSSYTNDLAHNPLVMVGSDRVFGDFNDPHDWYELFRKGAFPIYFDLCQRQGVPLEEIIRRVTSLPAQHFRLDGRGILEKGKAADIVIFNLQNFRYSTNEEIDASNPSSMANGVLYTIVNGKVVLDDRRVYELKAGQLLSKNGAIL
jgi:N-acyl-D-amino-acid deacylase